MLLTVNKQQNMYYANCWLRQEHNTGYEYRHTNVFFRFHISFCGMMTTIQYFIDNIVSNY